MSDLVGTQIVDFLTHMLILQGSELYHYATFGRVYEKECFSLLHTKYERSGPCGFREELIFPIVSLWELSVVLESSSHMICIKT